VRVRRTLPAAAAPVQADAIAFRAVVRGRIRLARDTGRPRDIALFGQGGRCSRVWIARWVLVSLVQA
jgi:hypothetical protein